MGSVRYRWGAWRYQQEMSTGGCGKCLDGDNVSKEFQSRIVLGKNEYLYTLVYGRPVVGL